MLSFRSLSGQIKRFAYQPRQANLVLIAYASSEDSGGPAHLRTSSKSRGTFRQKARSLNGWACAVKICHDGILGDTIGLTPHICIVNL